MARIVLALTLVLSVHVVASAQFIRIPVTAFRPSTVHVPIHGAVGASHGSSDLDTETILLIIGIVSVALILFVGWRQKRAESQPTPTQLYSPPLPTTTAARIMITSVPAGEAPLNIRTAWVGLELPVKNREPISVDGEGVITRTPTAAEWGYVVDAPTALQLLAIHRPEAASWWTSARHELNRPGAEFVFRDVECTKIE